VPPLVVLEASEREWRVMSRPYDGCVPVKERFSYLLHPHRFGPTVDAIPVQSSKKKPPVVSILHHPTPSCVPSYTSATRDSSTGSSFLSSSSSRNYRSSPDNGLEPRPLSTMFCHCFLPYHSLSSNISTNKTWSSDFYKNLRDHKVFHVVICIQECMVYIGIWRTRSSMPSILRHICVCGLDALFHNFFT
jgi:hypothetical protein